MTCFHYGILGKNKKSEEIGNRVEFMHAIRGMGSVRVRENSTDYIEVGYRPSGEESIRELKLLQEQLLALT